MTRKKFNECMQSVYLQAAKRAFGKKLTSQNHLHSLAHECYDRFMSTGAITITVDKMLADVDEEFGRQRAMYLKLELLKERFREMGIEYTIAGPEKNPGVLWQHGRSYGTMLEVPNPDGARSARLYAFPLVPASSSMSDERVVHVDKDVVIVIPWHGEGEENSILWSNDNLFAHRDVTDHYFEQRSPKPKHTTRGSRCVRPSGTRMEVSVYQNFLYVDVPKKIAEDTLRTWARNQGCIAVVVVSQKSGSQRLIPVP